jgi:hypothetical protein
MFRVIEQWNRERLEQMEQEAFDEVFEDLFDCPVERRVEWILRDADQWSTDSDSDDERFQDEDQHHASGDSDEVFQDDEDSESETDSDASEDSDTEWFTYDGWEADEPDNGEEMLAEIRYLQERFQRIRSAGFTVCPELLDNSYYQMVTNTDHFQYGECPLWNFVSKYKGRLGPDETPVVLQAKERDTCETISLILIF